MAEMRLEIKVLDRGWALVGWFSKTVDPEWGTPLWVMHRGATIRRWGTADGLGELQKNGPTRETVLDDELPGEIDHMRVIRTLLCDEKVWAKAMPRPKDAP